MKENLLTTILDNPELSSEIRRICISFPEYQQAAELADSWLETLKQTLGYEQFCEFEDAMIKYFGLEAQAHYLFGLRLRRELCAALFTDAC